MVCKAGKKIAKSVAKDAIKELLEKRLKKLACNLGKNATKKQKIKEIEDLANEILTLLDEPTSWAWEIITWTPIVGDACDACDTAAQINKIADKLAKLRQKEAALMKYLRNRGVRDAWKAERERLQKGLAGSRKWTEAEKKAILNGKVPKYKDANGNERPYIGHHKESVSSCPERADDSSNIEFVTDKEHRERHNWKPEDGLPEEIDDFLKPHPDDM